MNTGQIPLSTSRVGALEGDALDEELVRLFNPTERHGSLFHVLPPAWSDAPGTRAWKARWGTAFTLLTRLLLLAVPLIKYNTTIGQSLMGLVYRNAATSRKSNSPQIWQIGGYLFIRLVLPHLWTRYSKKLAEFLDGHYYRWQSTRSTLTRSIPGAYPPSDDLATSVPSIFMPIFSRLELVTQSLSFLSFLHFLIHGKHKTLAERIMKLTLVYHSEEVSRFLNYELMNREILWNELTEFMALLLPALNKSWITRLIFARRKAKDIPEAALRETVCPICLNPLCTPYRSNCNHEFCYYCLKSSMMDDPFFACPRCFTKVISIAPSVAVVEVL